MSVYVHTSSVPVHDRHVDVQNNGLEIVRRVRSHELGRLESVLSCLHQKVHLKLVLVPTQQKGVVVDNQYSMVEMKWLSVLSATLAELTAG